MRDRSIIKGLVIGIIILFLGVSFIPSISGIKENIINNEINEFYVKNIAEQYCVWWKWNETYHPCVSCDCEWNITCFNKIQDAINKAPKDGGCLIQVYNGTYNENIIIDNKSSITLQGELLNPGNVTIRGNGTEDVIKITGAFGSRVHNITIQYLNITNGIIGNGIDVKFSDITTITYCNIMSCSNGVHTLHTADDVISHNKILNNSVGFSLELSDRTKVEFCRIYYNDFGIATDSSDMFDILNNDIRDSKQIGLMIIRDVWPSGLNEIKYNNFINNHISGKYKQDATFLNCHNDWSDNYWREHIIPGIKLIFGAWQTQIQIIRFMMIEMDEHIKEGDPYVIIPWEGDP